MLVSAPATRALPGLIRRRGALEGLRIGLVGFGTRGRGHLRVFGYFDTDTGKARFIEHERMPGVEVVAICDTFQDNLDLGCEWVRKAGARATGYVDYREMLATADLDAVVIATPDHTHAPIAADAMRAGCDVYVEKCLSNNVEETLLLERLAAETGRIVQVGYQLRHDASHAVAKSLIQQGHIGEVRMVQMNLRRSGDNAGWTDPLAQTRRSTGRSSSGRRRASSTTRTATSSGGGTGTTRPASRGTSSPTAWTRPRWCSSSACRAAPSLPAASTTGRTAARRPTPSRRCSSTRAAISSSPSAP
jgi:hypothetical protein